MDRVEIAFQNRPVSPSELYWDIVKPSGREASIEVPQSRHDHPHDRDLNVGTCLIEHKEIGTVPLG